MSTDLKFGTEVWSAESIGTVAERVFRGAAWLDLNRPEWWRVVQVQTLDLSASCHCVLGQVFADDDAEGFSGFIFVGLQRIEAEVDFNWSAAHGFDAEEYVNEYGERVDFDRDFELLQAEWEDTIYRRQLAATAALVHQGHTLGEIAAGTTRPTLRVVG